MRVGCVATFSILLSDGATSWDNSVWPPQMLEWGRAQVLTPPAFGDRGGDLERKVENEI